VRTIVGAAALVVATVAIATALSARSESPQRPHLVPGAPAGQSRALRQLIPFRVRYRDLLRARPELVRTRRFSYVANDGRSTRGYLVLPSWYDRRRHPPIPLVIAPHGRGLSARTNLRFWGALPAFGPFAVVDPEGQGRRLTHYSWGWRGQIDDLARMPAIVEKAFPGLRIDRSRIYAIGSSMGGQETLLLIARHPHLLAGAAALDSATNMAARYRAFAELPGGRRLQRLARIEIGGTPAQVPRAYAARSPIEFARAIADSGVPLHLWWSVRDRIVRNQNGESGALYRAIVRINPAARVSKYVGTWAHGREMHPLTRLPLVLVRFGLIELDEPPPTAVTPLGATVPLGAGRSGSIQNAVGRLAS
jgi:pimeloyl-ACP methyl ester carboxylesterase